ncbi:MAG: 4-hydroxybutyrate CoA-transferase [Dehalococcoidia bacterium]|nr:MAG: 4-hydroxybutyrate CoA-transferase [Dehalococcoidia bacterium]
MIWRDEYVSKLCGYKEAASIVESGDRFLTAPGVCEPSTAMMDAIADRGHELEDVQYISFLQCHPYKIYQPAYRKTFRLMSCFYSSLTMHLHREGSSTYLPVQGSSVGHIVKERQVIDPRRVGLITQVSPPDDNGYVSLGLDLYYTPDLIAQSDWVIGEINPNMPKTYGDSLRHVSQFDKFVETDEPLFSPSIPEPTEVHKKIAENLVSLLRDRDCLQIGIGAVPSQVSRLILESGLKDLGIHSEMSPIGIRQLVEKGIVTGSYKKTHPGKIVLAFALGDRELYDFLGNNPMVEFYSASYCNSIPLLARENNLVAVNGAIEVDLVGTICSESFGDDIRSGTGGQLDFVIGAYFSEGGRAIHILPSITSDGKISRIEPYLSEGARVTVPRQYDQYIVTEWGIANLTALDEKERALALIKIAHPDYRDELLRVAKKRFKF